MNISVVFTQFPNLVIAGLSLSAIYLLVGLGYTLTYLSLKIINFANSEIFMLATFGSIIVSGKLLHLESDHVPESGLGALTPLVLGLLLSMLIGGVASVLLEIIAFRRLRLKGNNRLTTLIAAVGASLAIKELVRILTDSSPQSNPKILSDEIIFSIAGAPLKLDTLLTPILAMICYTICWSLIEKTRFGIRLRAISSNEKESQLLGINVNKIVTYSFLLAGALIGAGAFLYMNLYESTSFEVGFPIGLAGFTAAVLGGMGKVKGTLYGALLVGFVGQFSAVIFGSQWRDISIFIVLIVILVVKPNGILRRKVHK